MSAVAAISDPIAAHQPVAYDDVSERDALIARQESLLNTYRCRFNIDTQIVPGGCTNGMPRIGPTGPVTFEGVPTQFHLGVRDNLIAQQESLLNTYRCRFNIDTEVVPGGCTNGTPLAAGTPGHTTPIAYTAVAAGSRHACALRADQTIACWGNNDYRQSNPPDGKFTAVTAGREHACALRVDQTIDCWGNNDYGQTNAPVGQLTAISAGNWYTCGLRIDSTIACWGHNAYDQTDVAVGQFTAVATGGAFACGLRIDTTIDCWGDDGSGQADPPDGKFTAVSAGSWHACGLRTDSRIICWGTDWNSRTSVPAKLFNAVAVGSWHSCGLTRDQTIACWGDGSNGQTSAPDGRYTAISVHGDHSCALRTDSAVTCWGEIGYGQDNVPKGRFTAVSARGEHSCALRIDATIDCWGNNSFGQAEAPEGQYKAVSAGIWHTCALRTDATIDCWSITGSGRAEPPDGQYTAITAGGFHTCALRTDATIDCWGQDTHGQANPPAEQYTAISAGNRHTCALRTDATIDCWGNNSFGQATAPDGQYTAVSAGNWHTCALRIDAAIDCWGNRGWLAGPFDGPFGAVVTGDRHSCGLRVDATIDCWSLAPLVPPPGGAQQVIEAGPTDPELCKQQGVTFGTTAGFPIPRWAPAATGSLRVAVLFLDFPDAAATYSTYEEAALGLAFAEEYLESVSYGLLDVRFVVLHEWLRAEEEFSHYLGYSATRDASLRDIDEMATNLADSNFDFTGIDSVMIVMPSSYFNGGSGGGSAATDEGVVGATSRINTVPIDNRPQEPREWGSTGAHELAHNLGLADYYPYDDSHMLPEAPEGKAWAIFNFGLMHLKAHLLANPRDARFAIIWHLPSGHISTGYSPFLTAREMLAWSRWQLGWLDASQIRCVTEPEATVDLRPIATDPGSGIAMAAIPLSETEVIVIESRRSTGYDADRFLRTADGASTYLPALPVEGVLVYTVDSSLGSGQLPLKVAGDPGNGQVDYLPILTEGQHITVRGYTIAVQSATPDVHTVAIAKAEAG